MYTFVYIIQYDILYIPLRVRCTYFLTLSSNQIVHNLYWGPIHPGLPFSTHFFLVDKRAVSIFELINFMFWCFLFSERDGRKVIYICYLYRRLDQI